MINVREILAKSKADKTLGTHVFLISCILLVLTFFVWTTVGTLDVVSTTTGEVIPSSRVKSVQHLEGGIIREILVKEGERVKKGQALIKLQPTTSTAQVDELQVRLSSLKVKIARYEAEIAGKEALELTATLHSNLMLIERAKDLFSIRQQRLASQINEQMQLITQREQEVIGVKGRIGNNQKFLKHVDEQLAISTKLLKMSLTNRMRHLDLEKEGTRLQGEIIADKTIIIQTRAAVEQARARLSMIKNGFKEEARMELDAAQESFLELTERMKKFDDSLSRTVLRAPVDGVVKTLHVATLAGVIKAGQTVVDIVPLGDKLIIEAKLNTGDIGFIQPGQDVMVRLASMDAARFGAINGTVEHISPDTLVTEQGAPYYKVTITPGQNFFEKGTLRYDLVPGLQLQCDILIGERTVLEYMLSPYLQSMDMALRER